MRLTHLNKLCNNNNKDVVCFDIFFRVECVNSIFHRKYFTLRFELSM